MQPYSLLQNNWKTDLSGLFNDAEYDLLVCSPFVSREGTDFLLQCLTKSTRSSIHFRFLTNLSPQNVCQGATDPEALRSLAGRITVSSVTHLPRLHAKVYVADTKCAIITSGNLTAGGLRRTHEYGVLTTDSLIVARVREDIEALARLGARVDSAELLAYCAVARRVREAFQRQVSSVQKRVRQQFERDFRMAEDHLVRLRLRGSSPTKIFEDTILYLLKAQGSLSTRELHPQVQALHPDLCDDAVDRVIDGQHFGKRWKHMVRAAQSHLRDRGLVEIAGNKWRLKPHE
jgi:HKD family nuclease